MTHADFVHLHVHTQYSLLDGACQLEQLVDKAVNFKLPALAITDHGNLCGAIKFYSLCLKRGIKPIIGCEVYVAAESRHNKTHKKGEVTNYHLVLLARDQVGYKNLIKLASLGQVEGFYYKPRIDKEILSQYKDGLIGLSACLQGQVPYAVVAGEMDKAYKLADEYSSILGKGNFYLELMENDIPQQPIANKGLLKIAKDLKLPVVATNDVHYLDKEHSLAQEVLLCLQTQTTLADPNRYKFSGNSFYLRSPEEMKSLFKDCPEAIHNSLEITNRCNLSFDFSKYYLPHFPLPQGQDENSFLKQLCLDNLSRRYGQITEEINKRLEYELGVIGKMGFASYFLIVWDLISFSKNNGIPVGPGRGSAAGSIVSYLLGITDIEPLRYNLLFERFLNPARISMPDIDIDFCYEKRSRVLDYVAKKYGKENVAQIITFGSMMAKAAVRDVGRVMGFSYVDVDKIAKMIPVMLGHQITLKEALKMNPDLNNIYNSDPKIKHLIEVSMQLEGLSRHSSTHAAGVVISDLPLMERIPLVRGAEEEIVTGFDMSDLEKSGLLKMDFLGLKTLTVIEETIKIIKRTRGIEIDISNLPLDDPNTFSLLKDSETIGVFQLESQGMRDILKKLIPNRFEDLIAVLALYRPGPLASGMVDDFIQRKHGQKKITYLHPLLEPVLKETYGIILYQEQTMQIASVLAGFSMAQADLLRKAIGKKIPEIMQEQRKLFTEGCKKHKVSEALANQIFDLIDYFSGYGFNKSHSTAYALISYRTAYLKANYAVEFMAALMSTEQGNTDKIVEYVNESSRMEIKVLPPDINSSFAAFTVIDPANMRFGLLAIKNVGKAALENILQLRTQNKFNNIFDFFERIDNRTVNKKVLESLIRSGAMDSFGLKRAQMMAMLDSVLNKQTKKRDTAQLFLFEEEPKMPTIPQLEEWPLSDILAAEKDLLGIYVSSHPIQAYSKLLKFLMRTKIETALNDKTGGNVTICGVIDKVSIIMTKKQQRMAIITVEDEFAAIEVLIFPKLFENISNSLQERAVVLIKGKLEVKDNNNKILGEEVFSIERAYNTSKGLKIFIERDKVSLQKLKEIFTIHPGQVPVFFVLKGDKFQGMQIKTQKTMSLKLDDSVLDKLSLVVGDKNLQLIV